ncbi:MAG: FAD-dependent oxidoreductase [Burkholderiales bacterium]|nr:FAD-dependent oxidoreductase [Burkholderiales bacterium]
MRQNAPRVAPGSDRRIAVVGGGWAGIAAAVALAQAGAAVTVYEAARTLGGRARRVALEGIDLDNGQHILVGAYRATLEAMRTVGADPGALLLRQPLSLEIAGRFSLRLPRLPAPLHLVAGLAQAKGLTVAERLRIVRFVLATAARRYRLAADVAVPALLAVHRQLGRPTDHLWEPLCVAALNTPLVSASAQVLLNVLRDTLGAGRAASDLLLPRRDLSRLFPEPGARFVEARGGRVLLGRRIERLAPDGDGIAIDSERHEAAIVACAPHHAAQLLERSGLLPGLRGQLGAFAFEPIYTCYLQYDAAVALPHPMLGLREGLLQWAFDRGALDGRRGLVAAVVSARGAHEELEHGAFAATAHRELASALGGLSQPVWSHVIAERRATFSCTPGLARPGNATELPRLFLAGDYTAGDHPATLEGAVRSGLAAARLALAPTSPRRGRPPIGPPS